LTEQIKLHLEVQQATLKTLKGIDEGISKLKADVPVEREESSNVEVWRWKRIIP
jgi:hypothetical protein